MPRVELSPIEVVNNMLNAFSASDADRVAAYCAANARYLNVALPPAVVGHHAIRVGVQTLASHVTNLSVEVVASVMGGGLVMNRRIEKWLWKSDGLPVTLEVMGHFVVRNGLIAEWTDFFDEGQAQILKHLQAAAPTAPMGTA
ncbi:limonene-1,2-epoxide hydrolase family protein [Amycolatopsis sp. cg5]|uniref:nuclear transport factor 2 family protein n=1 Tax=Amycolatopsis sp. cg5 TaxID=3238802 RepID=UPI0035232C86